MNLQFSVLSLNSSRILKTKEIKNTKKASSVAKHHFKKTSDSNLSLLGDNRKAITARFLLPSHSKSISSIKHKKLTIADKKS